MKKLLGVLLLLAAVMAAGCSAGKVAGPAQKDEAVISVGTYMTSGGYDPCAGYGVWGPDIFHSALLTTNSKNELENDLAVSYKVSPDALTYTFELRKDARFADGKQVTAKDVVFTYQKAKTAGSAADLAVLDKAEALDDYTVAFTLKRPWSIFASTVATIGIVPEHAYNDNYGNQPLGSGPWKLVQFQKEQQLILAPNEYYYGPKPRLKKVTILKLDEDAALAAAKSGKVDVVLVESEFAKAKVPGMRLVEVDTVSGLVINLPTVPESKNAQGKTVGNPVTSDYAVRKALNIGISRSEIVKNALNGFGVPAYGWSGALPWSNPQAAFEDNRVEEARRILTDAGWVDSDGDGIREKNGVRAEFVITGRSNDLQRYNTVVAVAAEAKKLGINIIPRAAAWSEARVAMATPTCWDFGAYNPLHFYQHFHSSQIGKNVINNSASYRNAKVDAYIEKALAATNVAEANEFWKLAQWDGQTGAKADYPYLWVANPRLMYFVRDGLDIGSQKVNVRGQGMSVVYNLSQWCWK